MNNPSRTLILGFIALATALLLSARDAVRVINTNALAQPAVMSVLELPQIHENEPSGMFSSWDRSGGNDDGFKGTYSKLRLENGNSVLAEMEGAGCITRFWMPHTKHFKPDGKTIEQGLFVGKTVHLKIYLDGAEEPQIDLEINKLFSGEVEGFPQPLVGSGHGGFFCYVPIYYTKGCKVVMDGDHMTFYQLNYTELHPAKAPRTSGIFRASNQTLINSMEHSGIKNASPTSKKLSWTHQAQPGVKIVQNLPTGSHRIDSLNFQSANREALLKGRFKCYWDDAALPAIDLPLAHFLAQTPMTEDYESALVGVNASGFYNYMPMPYRKAARLELEFPEPVNFKLHAIITPLSATDNLGYLHTHYAEYLPVKRGQFIEVLKTEGTGHYIGTFIDTRRDELYDMGYDHLIRWLEGDEIITVDGEMTMHGTGTEDYFNCGWYQVPGRLDSAGTYPLHGFSVFSLKTPIKAAAAYRWHLEAPIRFEESFEFKLEHGDHNSHPADYRTTAFYYLNTAEK